MEIFAREQSSEHKASTALNGRIPLSISTSLAPLQDSTLAVHDTTADNSAHSKATGGVTLPSVVGASRMPNIPHRCHLWAAGPTPPMLRAAPFLRPCTQAARRSDKTDLWLLGCGDFCACRRWSTADLDKSKLSQRRPLDPHPPQTSD